MDMLAQSCPSQPCHLHWLLHALILEGSVEVKGKMRALMSGC